MNRGGGGVISAPPFVPLPSAGGVLAEVLTGDEPFAQLGSYDYLDDPNGLFADKGDDAATHAY